MQKNFKNSPFIILGILFCLNIFAWVKVWDLSQPQFLEVVFFDVGQGDATLIKTAEGHYILIDGGPSSVILEKMAKELSFWTKKIDLIVLTHFHDDHFNGLIDIIERYNVENILWNGAVEESAAFGKWENLLLASGAEKRIAWSGQRIRGKNFFIDVLHPFSNLEGTEIKNANLSSLVLRLSFGDNSFLFMGDAYKSIEKELMGKENLTSLSSNVLKVGHHGSKTSTVEEFVATVLPEIAIISAGENNRYGHPHQETVDILKQYDINVLRTDLKGDIKIFSDGETLKIKKK